MCKNAMCTIDVHPDDRLPLWLPVVVHLDGAQGPGAGSDAPRGAPSTGITVQQDKKVSHLLALLFPHLPLVFVTKANLR